MATLADHNGRRPWWQYALFTVPLIVVVGSAMGYVSNSGFGNPWYDGLEKPSFQPPGWVFGVTWTTLYTLMGIALALVLAAPHSKPRTRGLILFAVQLILNFSWSPVFFGAGMIDAAFLVILAMNVTVTMTIICFWRVKALAGALLLPYLAWLCLATTLNWETGRLNPGADRAPLGITGA